MPGIVDGPGSVRVSPQPVCCPGRCPLGPDRPASDAPGPAAAVPDDPGRVVLILTDLHGHHFTTARISRLNA